MRRWRTAAWSLFVLAVIAASGGLWFGARNGTISFEDVGMLVVFMAFGVVGAIVVARQSRNVVGWLFLATSVVAGFAFFSDEYSRYGFLTEPGSLPGAVWGAWLSDWLWGFLLAIPFVFVPLFFPDGRLPSRRWRPFLWIATAFVAAALLTFAFGPGPIGYAHVPNPLGVRWLASVVRFLDGPGFFLLIALGFISLASVIVRYRRAHREQRQQIKWVMYGLSVLAAFFAFDALTQALGIETPDAFSSAGAVIAFGMLPAGAGIAMLRHRLFDVDVVIRKTVVVGVLAAFITGAYFLVVVGIPTVLFGAAGGAESLVPFAAAAVLAIAFQPIRRWARRLADHLVYGKRATPYEVLSEFADRMATTYSLEDVLPRLARLVAEGTGARRVGVWVHVGGELRREATWPSDAAAWPSSLPEDAVDVPDASRTIPVTHRGERLGLIAVEMPAREALTPTHEKLLDDVAAQAALVLRNVALVEDLRASRQRIVAAQDEERRRLERNIHDGAQQELVALAVKLRLIETFARKDSEKAATLAAETKEQLQHAVENLRDLARGIYPPLLADKGLAAALQAQARKVPFPVEVQPNGVGRYPQEVEAAIYFCVLEALQNAAKYSDASSVSVRLKAENGEVLFEVEDDGKGFDPSGTPRGSGLQNMSDRIEALGGTLEITSRPGRGTTVRGLLPVSEEGRKS